MSKEDLIETLILKFLSGEASDNERENFLHWLSENKENRLHYFAIKRIWLENKEIKDKEERTESSWNRLKLRTDLSSLKNANKDSFPQLNFKYISVAASIIILLGISSFLGIKLKDLSDFGHTEHVISVPLGARTNLVLPDGSNVWLNAGSTLIYQSDFGRRDRNLALTGEAFFDISYDENKIFTVNTRDIDIRVLGTKFNVKNYPEEDVTETTLVSGKVEVVVTEEGISAQPVYLSSNQRMTYSRDTRRLLVEDSQSEPDDIIAEAESISPEGPSLFVSNVSNTEEYTSWKDGKLTFRSESLATLAPKLERYYNVNIHFEGDSIKELIYTGTLEEVTIEEVLRAIASVSNIEFKIDKNQIILSK